MAIYRFIYSASKWSRGCFHGRDELAGEAHTNYKLHQTKGNEWIILTNPTELRSKILFGLNDTKQIIQGAELQMAQIIWGVLIHQHKCNGQIHFRVAFKPIFRALGGIFTGGVNINVSSTSTTNTIATNVGEFPKCMVYTNQLTFNKHTILKARSYSSNPQMLPGFIEFHTYFTHDNATTTYYLNIRK